MSVCLCTCPQICFESPLRFYIVVFMVLLMFLHTHAHPCKYYLAARGCAFMRVTCTWLFECLIGWGWDGSESSAVGQWGTYHACLIHTHSMQPENIKGDLHWQLPGSTTLCEKKRYKSFCGARGSCTKSKKLPQVMSFQSVLVGAEEYRFENEFKKKEKLGMWS